MMEMQQLLDKRMPAGFTRNPGRVTSGVDLVKTAGPVQAAMLVFLAGLVLAGSLLLAATSVQAGDSGQTSAIPEYRPDAEPLTDTPGSSSSPAAGLLNPAAWSIRPEGGYYLGWTEGTDAGSGSPDRLQAVASMRFLSFGYQYHKLNPQAGPSAHLHDYTLGLGFGDRSHSGGLSYSWSGGDTDRIPRHDRLGLGSVSRMRWFSLGTAALIDLEEDDYWIQGDLGVRPIGPRVTLFGDVVGRKGQQWEDWTLGGGLRVIPIPGVSLAAKASDFGPQTNFSFEVGLSLFPGDAQSSLGMHTNQDGDHTGTTYSTESGPIGSYIGRGLFGRGKDYPELHLGGPLAYRTYKLFDDRRRLLPLLSQIRTMAEDPRVGGLVLNLSGMQIPAEMTWELRQQLAGFRAKGKTVTIYLDRAGMSGYSLATVADQIWMDPQGDLTLYGITLGRTYIKNMLDKLGIGVDELRFFKYKSAVEGLSRTSMSDADREQMDDFAGDLYEYVTRTVTQARGISREEWDHVINDQGILMASEAQAAGLVDSIGTLKDARKAAPKVERRATPDPETTLDGVGGDVVWGPMEWGEPDQIAILYAIGECAMDSGIKGPLLARKIRQARENPRVKAVVLRADSPGGDALPSDLVARELKQTAEVKPVIVSQGSVAGSGGYWISMYADTILAAPMTVTGSIGVIGAYIYDNGFGEKVGLTYDQVKRGNSSDIERGPTLPLLGATIPHRPLTEKERARAEDLIRAMYKEFVGFVAEGRDMTPEEVDEVGQGHFYSGTRGAEIGLVDEIGGLWDAVRLAKAAAGMDPDARVEFVEEPELGWFNFGFAGPSLVGLFLGLADDGGAGLGPDTEAGHLDTPWGLNPETSQLRQLLGEAAFLRIPVPDRLYLEAMLRNQGHPVLMMDPLTLEDGVR